MEQVREQRRQGILGQVDTAYVEIEELKQDFPDNPNARNNAIARRLDAIDKEAKLTGAYQDNRPNDVTIEAALRCYADAIIEFKDDPEQLSLLLNRFSFVAKMPPEQFALKAAEQQ